MKSYLLHCIHEAMGEILGRRLPAAALGTLVEIVRWVLGRHHPYLENQIVPAGSDSGNGPPFKESPNPNPAQLLYPPLHKLPGDPPRIRRQIIVRREKDLARVGEFHGEVAGSSIVQLLYPPLSPLSSPMGTDSHQKTARRKKRYDTSDSSSSSSSASETTERRSSHRRRSRHKSGREAADGDEKSGRKKSRRDRDAREKRKRDKRSKYRRDHKRRDSRSESSGSSSGDDSNPNSAGPVAVLRKIFESFPNVATELKQLLQMIDDGQAVDTRGISDRPLRKLLKNLFLSLNLKENGAGVFLLPQTARPTLEILGALILTRLQHKETQMDPSPPNQPESLPSNLEDRETTNEGDASQSIGPLEKDNSSVASNRRIIGPAMPSSELLAAAAKLTEAETDLREAEFDIENDLFIGPPPPAVVAEAESANEAERFEEVTRIVGAEVNTPYDVVGVNHKMSVDNIKKRYWKLSLMVHPDKCSHPQAHQAFIILNKAFKQIQDPEKKKAIDDKIREKEEQEAFKVELRALREAAQWRKLQGISMEGDDELLAEPKLPPRRDEWMTKVPPERKPGGVSMHSTTSFSRTGKEGRGDTSIWTDNPLDKAQKAKINYLEAYNKTKELAATEDRQPTSAAAADLVDTYNRSKRSISLVQKVHQEEASKRPKKKKNKEHGKKEEWVGEHPWKPWDRETDLVAGRQKVNFDSENMTQGLSSRFAGGTVQRNFL